MLHDTSRQDHPQVFSYLDEHDFAKIRVNSKLHSLRMVHSQGDAEIWSDCGIVVSLRYIRSQDSDESLVSKGTMTITLGKAQRVYKVRGYIGC